MPIIHTTADMGSLGADLGVLAEKELGGSWWQEHRRTISLFWDYVANFFDSLDVRGLKVYQDGLVANGAEGLRIVREGAKQGSKNFEIIGKLLEHGAVLVKTEDPALVKQEYAYIAKMAHSKLLKEKEAWALRYKLAQGSLLRQRDNFIAKRITETLGEGETGILFIGAYHNILSKLASDIQVTQVRDVAKTRQYHKTLATKMDNSI